MGSKLFNKKLNIIINTLTLILPFCVIFFAFNMPHYDISFGKEEAKEYSGWYYYSADGAKNNMEYNNDIPSLTSNPREYSIFNTIPDDITDNSYIFVRIGEESSHAYIDDKLIYKIETLHSEPMFPRLTGYVWNMIKIPENSGGKTIKLDILSDYDNSNFIVDKIYIGPVQNIVKTIMMHNIKLILFYFVIIILGILLIIVDIVIYLFTKYKFGALSDEAMNYRRSYSVVSVGLIAIFSGTWLLFKNPGIYAFISNSNFRIITVYISVLLLIMSCMFYVRNLFISEKYRENLANLIVLYTAVLCIIIILQIFAISEIGANLVYALAVAIVFAIFAFFYSYAESKDGKNTSAKALMFTISILLVTVTIESYQFSFVKRENSNFSIIALMTIIVFLLFKSVKDIISIVNSSYKANYYEFLSLTDVMTNLSNRMAYNDKVTEIKNNPQSDMSVILCDLNNLKYINDHFGHAEGDSFIIEASKILTSLFNIEDIYRIGGDEFAVFYDSSDINDVEGVISKINLMCEEKAKTLSYPFSIGIGYEIFHKNIDHIDEVIASADLKMYLDKGVKSRDFKK